MPKSGRPNPELAKPRIARGGGPMPTHVSYIFADIDGHYRLQIHERGGMRSQLGFHRELVCADTLEYDAQMEFLIEKRVPFMVGHMSPGASDDAFFWLKDKGRRIDYLEIAFGGKTEWEVREIFEDAKEWRGVKLKELLLPEIDLFAPENRPQVQRPEPPTQPPEPTPHTTAPEPETTPPPPPPSPAVESDPAAAPEPELPPAELEPPPPAPPPEPSPEASALPRETAALPGRRWVEYGSAAIPLLVLIWSLSNFLGPGPIMVHSDLGDMILSSILAALAGALVYAAPWFIVFPRYFPRWTQRLELLAISFLIGLLIALCELFLFNVHHDAAPLVELQTTINAKTIFKGKNGRHPPEFWTYHLTVEPWPGTSDEQHLRVSRAAWETLEPGKRIAFRAHPGRLGWAWYTVAELEAPNFLIVLQR